MVYIYEKLIHIKPRLVLTSSDNWTNNLYLSMKPLLVLTSSDNRTNNLSLSMAAPVGLEPTTSWLTVKRSTNWATRQYLTWRDCLLHRVIRSFNQSSTAQHSFSGYYKFFNLSLLYINIISYFFKKIKKDFSQDNFYIMMFFQLNYLPMVGRKVLEPLTFIPLKIHCWYCLSLIIIS